MSLLRLPPDLQDEFEIIARPKRSFFSSSAGVFGTVRVFPDLGSSLKEVPRESNTDAFNAVNLEELRVDTVNKLRTITAIGTRAELTGSSGLFLGSPFGAEIQITGSVPYFDNGGGNPLSIKVVEPIPAPTPSANTIKIIGTGRHASGSITIDNIDSVTGTYELVDYEGNVVFFSPNGSSSTASKSDSENYTFGTDSVGNTATLATRLYDAIALAKTNGDLKITATSPTASTILLRQDRYGREGNTIIRGSAITGIARNASSLGFINGESFNQLDRADLTRLAFSGSTALGVSLAGGADGDTGDIVYATSGIGSKERRPFLNCVINDTALLDINALDVGSAGNTITFTNIDGGMADPKEPNLKGGVDKNHGSVDQYMNKVNELPQSVTRGKRMEVLRFEPSFKLTSDTGRKNTITNTLFPYYAGVYPGGSDFSFTNYHTLNFFSSDKVPSDSVMIYPSPRTDDRHSLYRPTGSFTTEFYINPRYTCDSIDSGFAAGTILHISSTLAVSLISGSAVDFSGKTSGYRVMLQLSHSADIPPSLVDIEAVDAGTATHPSDLVFISKDNVLKKDVWEHVAIRWGTLYEQAGTGSFVIGGQPSSEFVAPYFAIGPDLFGPSKGEASALFVGNFYEGQNSDIDLISLFFNSSKAKSDGLVDMWDKNYSAQDPRTYTFRHPLNAEVHELKLFDVHRGLEQIQHDRDNGTQDLNEEGLLFYLPPFFVRATPERDVPVTPFQTVKKTTKYPFNTDMSFGVGGHLLNLENYVKDFKNNVFPRLLNLSASVITTATDWASANAHLYASGSIRKRNLTILPNDNGKFVPDFEVLEKSVIGEGEKWPLLYITNSMSKDEQLDLYRNDRREYNPSIVTLRNYVPTGSSTFPRINDAGDMIDSLVGAGPDNPFGAVDANGNTLAIYFATRDPDSHEVSFFDVSNLFYGSEILENTFTLTDPSVTGSGGKVKITLKDHNGILHRADCTGSVAKWSGVGSILYEEGLVTIKSPTLPRFGKDAFNCEFQGLNTVFSKRIGIPIDPGELIISKNKTFIDGLRPGVLTPDFEEDFTYITDIDILDDDMNVVARATLAQPMIKRNSDNFLIRCKLDF